MTFTVATHNARKGKANFPQIASVVVRQEMWAKKARRRLAKVPGTTSWYGRYGLTVTWRSDEWTPGAGASWRAHKGRAGITPQRGVARKFLTHDDGTEVAVFAVHHINGARHNKWKFARTSKFRESRWVMAQRLLERKVAETRRTHPGAVIVVAGDFNADDPHLLDLKRRGHRIDWLFWDSARLDAFDVLGKHGSDHPMLRARFTAKEASSMTKIITRAAWGARPRGATRASHPIGSTIGITAHWEGPHMGTFPHSACAGKVRGIEAFHRDTRKWADIAYNAIVCPHGYVFEGRGPGVKSAANGNGRANDDWYAVCYLGGERDGFTAEGRDGFLAAFGWLTEKGDAGPKRNGHRDHKSTMCPGPEIYAWVHSLPDGAGANHQEDDMANYADQLDRIEKKLDHFRKRERARDAADKRRANQIKKLLRDVPEEIVIAVIDAANADQEDAS